MHQVSRTVDSITLSWSQPDQPNGVILDYELQYYEKVPVFLGAAPTPHLTQGPPPSGWPLGFYHPARRGRPVKQKEPWPQLHSSLAVRPQAGALTSLSLAFLVLGIRAQSVKCSGHSPFPTETPFIWTLKGLMF